MSAASLYQQLFSEDIPMEDSYHMPFKCKIYMGVILMVSIILYQKTRPSSNKKSNKSGSTSPSGTSTRYNNPSSFNPSITSVNGSKSTYNLEHTSHPQSLSKPQSPPHNNNPTMHGLNKQCSCPSHTSSSSSSLPHSFSTSLLERTNIPNQKYRKQDPDTRYDDDGTRYQCVSIPYRINPETNKVEIFMITSRNRGDYIFPGGGWEKHETGPECAQREAWEEAGVRGNIIKEVVTDQHYTSDKGNKSRLWGYLLEVTKVEEIWPEPERRRKWMSVEEAEIALPEKRRIKFGALWRNGTNYFIEQSLYHPNNNPKSNGKNGYHNHSHNSSHDQSLLFNKNRSNNSKNIS
mmetsp:Transcript_59476/g.53556  ORF Transcript_59476/g.53556 Transcript_59476/m.53556 type:complete len:348 (-) Transcript_59476:356-1399(-)